MNYSLSNMLDGDVSGRNTNYRRHLSYSIVCLVSFVFFVSSLAADDFVLRERCETDLDTDGRNYPSFQPYHCPTSAEGVFSLRQDYPTQMQDEFQPWKSINFTTQSKRYAETVLQYCFEGNVNVNFDIRKNPVRNWYHAPWQHHDSISCGNGREYHNGLTRERPIPPGEFHDNQTDNLEAWAIGYYNATGAVTLGSIWPGFGIAPEPAAAEFAEGTVACKLLFTDGGPDGNVSDQLPFLEGTIQWTANIYPKQPYDGHSRREEKCFTDGTEKRVDRPVFLTQIDIAVKDDRSPVNWVFGTFLYNADKEDAWESSSTSSDRNRWNRFDVIGLSWGDDSNVSLMKNTPGAFVNPALKETWLNRNLVATQWEAPENHAYMKFHGLGGRLNGPVDNPVSSCISCHARASLVADDLTRRHPMGIWEKGQNRETINQEVFAEYFATLPSGARSENGFVFFDYSMQVAFGLQNHSRMLKLKESENQELITELAPVSDEDNKLGVAGFSDRSGVLDKD